ncbi:MAG TPA: hypothetical protein DCR93_28850 [Cytophagales bacterium]|nr:hypothetical protein [Cytophagales bacterium]
MVSLLLLRSDVETSILRTPGMTYQVREDGRISNLYNVSMLNKTTEELPLRLELVSPAGELSWVGDGISHVEQQASAEGTLFMIIDKQNLNPMKTEVEVAVYRGEELIETVKTNFMGPF